MRSQSNRIRTVREAIGMTQRDLATKAGLSQSTLSNLERGDVSPRVDSLRRLAPVLNVPPGELLLI